MCLIEGRFEWIHAPLCRCASRYFYLLAAAFADMILHHTYRILKFIETKKTFIFSIRFHTLARYFPPSRLDPDLQISLATEHNRT